MVSFRIERSELSASVSAQSAKSANFEATAASHLRLWHYLLLLIFGFVLIILKIT